MLKRLMFKVMILIVAMVVIVSYPLSAMAQPQPNFLIEPAQPVNVEQNTRLRCTTQEEGHVANLLFLRLLENEPQKFVIQQIVAGEYPTIVNTYAATEIVNIGLDRAVCVLHQN